MTGDISLLNLLDAPVTEVTAHTSVVAYVPRDVVHIPEPLVTLPVPGVGEAIMKALPQGEEQTVADPLEAPMAIVTIVWLTGMVAMAVWGAVSLAWLRRRLVGAILLEKGVYLADHIDTSFVQGLVRPKIYLPSALGSGGVQFHTRCHSAERPHEDSTPKRRPVLLIFTGNEQELLYSSGLGPEWVSYQQIRLSGHPSSSGSFPKLAVSGSFFCKKCKTVTRTNEVSVHGYLV